MTIAAGPSVFVPLSAHRHPGPQPWFGELLASPRSRKRGAARRDHSGADAANDQTPSLVLDTGLRASVATTAIERLSAHDLVRKRYAWRGYGDVSLEGVCACSDPDCDRRQTLIAVDEGRIVGTLTLGSDSECGLFVDETYRSEADVLRDAGRRLCEITRFAIDERVQSKAALAALFGLAYRIGRSLHRATDVLVEVNPRHVAFYRRVLAFSIASEERRCTRVDAPAVLLRLEAEALEERLAALGCPPLAPA